MFTVTARFFKTHNKGTAHEFRSVDPATTSISGPFETRSSAESFARQLAASGDLSSVTIEEEPHV